MSKGRIWVCRVAGAPMAFHARCPQHGIVPGSHLSIAAAVGALTAHAEREHR